MNILQTLQRLRDDIKLWATNNFNALNAKIDEKTIPIDNKLSSTSTNPVQNKVIKKAIDNIPKFSGDYNDLTNAPNITEDDSGNMIIADESGNVIFKADADGAHTTALTINGVNAATEAYVDEAVSNIDVPETDLSDYYNKLEMNIIIDSVKKELSESIVTEMDEWKIVDEAGNIIAKVDANGLETTTVVAEAIIVNGIDLESGMATTADISTHNTSTSAHNDIRMLVSELAARLNALADSDDVTLDQISEIVAYIKSNKSLIDSVTTSKVNTADIIDDLTTNVTNKPLSAAQGVVLKILIDSLQSALDAKVPNTRTINGNPLSGDIVLSASDVGAVTQKYVDDTITAALAEVENGSY